MYYFGARYYAGWIGIFTSIDPLLAKYPSVSPYAYCMNNPVKFIDPDGNLPVLAVFGIKGAIGATIDVSAQITVSKASGKSWGQAVSSIDITSVGASFIVAAIGAPGMSTAKKAIAGTTIAANAAVDFKAEDGFTSIFSGDKTYTGAAIDVATSVIPAKGTDKLTSGFNKAFAKDLGSATIRKETREALRQTQKIVNSDVFQTSVNSTADYMGNIIGGGVTETIDVNTTKSNDVPVKNISSGSLPDLKLQPSIVQSDVTQVQIPAAKGGYMPEPEKAVSSSSFPDLELQPNIAQPDATQVQIPAQRTNVKRNLR